MDLKKIDLDKLQDYAFTPHELAMSEMALDEKFINIKCLDNESIVPTVKAIPLDKVKQARRELDKLPIYGAKFTNEYRIHLDREEVFSILDNLVAESEG